MGFCLCLLYVDEYTSGSDTRNAMTAFERGIDTLSLFGSYFRRSYSSYADQIWASVYPWLQIGKNDHTAWTWIYTKSHKYTLEYLNWTICAQVALLCTDWVVYAIIHHTLVQQSHKHDPTKQFCTSSYTKISTFPIRKKMQGPVQQS